MCDLVYFGAVVVWVMVAFAGTARRLGFCDASGPAVAAHFPAVPYYTKAAAMVAAISAWSGFYIGANGGWGGDRTSSAQSIPETSSK